MGRPWRLVHAEIAERLSVRSAVQKHVLDHLREIVAERVWFDEDRVLYADNIFGVRALESQGGWRRYYVGPTTGLLRAAPPRRKPPGKAPDLSRRPIDETRELRLLGGAWFEVHLATIPSCPEARAACFDCICRRAPEIVDRRDLAAPEHWKAGRFAVTKRQLSQREIAAYGLRRGIP